MTHAEQVIRMAHGLGNLRKVHTAVPPFHLGGDLVDVLELEDRGGGTIYLTSGLADRAPDRAPGCHAAVLAAVPEGRGAVAGGQEARRVLFAEARETRA